MLNLCVPTYDPADSYGRIARELHGAWSRAGHGTQVFSLGNDAPPIEGVFDIHARSLMCGYPTLYGQQPMATRLTKGGALTMFESTQLPEHWADILNAFCRFVAVPSRWAAELFRAQGVTVPLHVLPLGVRTDTYCYQERSAGRPFTVLAIADRGERKGWHHALFAFRRAFGDDPGVRLILKTRRSGMEMGVPQHANVEVLAADLSETDLSALYARADVMVFATHGEGFGLPPREFAATGGIALATDWSGTADDLEQWGVAIPVQGMAPAWRGHDTLEGLGQWAVPSEDAVTALLRFLRALPLHARNEMGQRYSRAVKALYSWDETAEQLFHLMTKDV